jgi:hypothetical protein
VAVIPFSENFPIMPNPANLQSKYLQLPPSNPWPSVAGTRFLASLMADIDGDGCAEVIALSPQYPGLSEASLGLLSYFDNTALSDVYPSPQPPQLLATGGMAYSSTQSTTPVTVRGAGLVDLMVFDGSEQTLELYSWINNALAYRWATSPNVYGSSTWPLAAGNRLFFGDIDGDGAQEIIALSNSTDAANSTPASLAIFKWINDSDIQVIWTAPDGVISGANGIDWNVFSADLFYIGDVDGDGTNEIVAFDGNSFIGVMKWNASAGELQINWITSS